MGGKSTRLSRIVALSCSTICFSKASMESRLISLSIAVGETASGAAEGLEVPPTHKGDDPSSRLKGVRDLAVGDAAG